MSCFSFAHFYETWLDQLHHLVRHLSSADKKPPLTAEEGGDNNILHFVDKVMSHYHHYYRTKSLSAVKNPLGVIAAPWATTIERSLHWIGWWPPTTAFHVVYTESSVLLKSHVSVDDILRGLCSGDLADLSPAQFRRDSELQCDTVKEENAITEEMSEWQNNASELMMMGEGEGRDMEEKIGRLVSIVRKADNLRLRTLRSMVDLLSPQQAVKFLIASTELLFRIRGWGSVITIVHVADNGIISF